MMLSSDICQKNRGLFGLNKSFKIMGFFVSRYIGIVHWNEVCGDGRLWRETARIERPSVYAYPACTQGTFFYSRDSNKQAMNPNYYFSFRMFMQN